MRYVEHAKQTSLTHVHQWPDTAQVRLSAWCIPTFKEKVHPKIIIQIQPNHLDSLYPVSEAINQQDAALLNILCLISL